MVVSLVVRMAVMCSMAEDLVERMAVSWAEKMVAT